MRVKRIILNATERVHRAVKTAASGKSKSINELCLEIIVKDPRIKQELK